MHIQLNYQKIILYSCIAFIILNAVFVSYGIFYFSLLPVVLLIFFLALFAIDKLALITVFLVPLSINIENSDFNVSLFLPSEPLIFGLMLIYILKLLFGDYNNKKKLFLHPVSIAIILHLIWILFTSITSTIPIVSFKFFLSRMWFVVFAFYILSHLFLYSKKNMDYFLWLYIIPLSVIVIYTLIRHASFSFAQKPAHWVMEPFFKDHTSYGAVLSMFFPVSIAYFFRKDINAVKKILILIIILIFATGIVFSYTRAAWLSLLASFILFIFIVLKIKLRTIVTTLTFLIILFFTFKDQLIIQIEKNRQSASNELTKHVQSIINIKNDYSNLERINRWNSAIRMFKEKAILGWGPGTYQFQYAPFQSPAEKTIISTNFGNKGNAHSEYLGALSESGFPALLLFLIIIILTLYTGLNLYSKLDDYNLRITLLSVILGIFTYYIHGFLNNFLDTDKASIPFWGFTSLIVSLDLMQKKQISF